MSDLIPLEIIYNYPESSCACDKCQSMCRRPCWPMPEDAEKLLDAGYGDRLMLDWYFLQDRRIALLAPAIPGHEGKLAPCSEDPAEIAKTDPLRAMLVTMQMLAEMPKLNGGCTFHGKDGLCELHDKGLKPTEGKRTRHDIKNEEIHEAVATTWDNAYGREIVDKWKKTRGL